MKHNGVVKCVRGIIVCAAVVVSVMGFASLASASPDSVTAVAAQEIVDPTTPPVVRPAPVLVVSSYETSAKRLLVGSPFVLTLDIRNETPRRAENVVVSLAGASGAPPEGGGPGGGLTVLGTGNAKFLGPLRGRSEQAVTFKVVAGPGTTPGATTIPVTISFEYDGERHDLTYTIGLVLERDAVLAIAAAEIPATARVGQPFEASFELANSGGFTLTGFSLSVEATGATVTDGNMYVGAFEAASAETIDVSITPEKAGPLEVTVVAKYRDDFGREKTFRSVHTVKVEGEPKPVDGTTDGGPDAEDKETGNWLVRFIKALFGLGS